MTKIGPKTKIDDFSNTDDLDEDLTDTDWPEEFGAPPVETQAHDIYNAVDPNWNQKSVRDMVVRGVETILRDRYHREPSPAEVGRFLHLFAVHAVGAYQNIGDSGVMDEIIRQAVEPTPEERLRFYVLQDPQGKVS